MYKETAETALSLVQKLPDIFRSSRSNSLIQFSKPTRVEPICLMDDRCVNISFISDVMQSLTSIFSGYYLQAAALSVNVGKVDVIGLLDRINPNRSLDDNVVKGILNTDLRPGMLSMESYEHALPTPDDKMGVEHFGLEASGVLGALSGDEGPDGTLSDMSDAMKAAREVSNLSVGKLLQVEVSSGQQKATFPVAVRLIVTAAPSNGVVHTLSLGQRNTGVKERYHAWRAGQLEFMRDLVLCQDLIKAHKEGLMYDESGIYNASMKRRRANSLSAIFSGQPSVATVSNIVIISDQTRKDLERKIGGRLKDFRTREKLMNSTYTMLLVVIDPDWELVTIYHHSIDTPTELSASDMKNPSAKGGPDITEILKAYTEGKSPSL